MNRRILQGSAVTKWSEQDSAWVNYHDTKDLSHWKKPGVDQPNTFVLVECSKCGALLDEPSKPDILCPPHAAMGLDACGQLAVFLCSESNQYLAGDASQLPNALYWLTDPTLFTQNFPTRTKHGLPHMPGLHSHPTYH